MLTKLLDWPARVSQHFREQRMARFLREIPLTRETRVLDVGGAPETWAGVSARIVILNMPRAAEAFGNILAVGGDGCALPFADQSFDVVFSNSVIEHVGSWEKQQRFATEVARVGRRYWVQTPNRGFPVETHLLTPFLHWLPRGMQRSIAPRFTVWAMLTKASAEQREWYVRHFLNDIRLLDAAQMTALFPGATLVRERAGGFVKSLIAMR